jgi:tRNA threonylcarbamoyladenosine biosynthesis protein TsaB
LKVLAVDTSSTVAAVAVIENTKLLGEYVINHKKTHSQKLMPLINELLKSLELSPGEIDIYSASIGPGSFTGLRIGVTSIKAIAYAAQKPVVSVPTLDALAYNIPVTEHIVCPVMDARNNQVYTAIYKNEMGNQTKISEYMGLPVADLVEILRGKNRTIVFTGDAVELHRDFLKEQLLDKCEFAPIHLLHQRASSVAALALMSALAGKVESSFDMVPFYLRKSQAEREYERKQEAKE